MHYFWLQLFLKCVVYNVILRRISSTPLTNSSDISGGSLQNFTRPSSRWAIFALMPEFSSQLKKRNEFLRRYLQLHRPMHGDLTMIFFSEHVFTEGDLLYLREQFAGLADVIAIDTSSKLYSRNAPETAAEQVGGNGGYRYMCKFFAIDVYSYLQQYDYYWRIDSDCFLFKLDYNIFSWMESSNIEFGMVGVSPEHHAATMNTLPPFVLQYVKTVGIVSSSLVETPLSDVVEFHNNFHLGKVSFFRSSRVQHFLLAVNSSNNILRHRWGDSPIQVKLYSISAIYKF